MSDEIKKNWWPGWCPGLSKPSVNLSQKSRYLGRDSTLDLFDMTVNVARYDGKRSSIWHLKFGGSPAWFRPRSFLAKAQHPIASCFNTHKCSIQLKNQRVEMWMHKIVNNKDLSFFDQLLHPSCLTRVRPSPDINLVLATHHFDAL
jgi:hypothetical protein